MVLYSPDSFVHCTIGCLAISLALTKMSPGIAQCPQGGKSALGRNTAIEVPYPTDLSTLVRKSILLNSYNSSLRENSSWLSPSPVPIPKPMRVTRAMRFFDWLSLCRVPSLRMWAAPGVKPHRIGPLRRRCFGIPGSQRSVSATPRDGFLAVYSIVSRTDLFS